MVGRRKMNTCENCAHWQRNDSQANRDEGRCYNDKDVHLSGLFVRMWTHRTYWCKHFYKFLRVDREG